MNRAEFMLSTGATLVAAATPLPSNIVEVAGGRTFVAPFASAPYPHASRAQGHTYQKQLFDAAQHYSNSDVAIFVPDGWHDTNGAVDLIVHFYGWRHDIAATLKTYRLREQLVASKRNAILIVPEGPTNAPDSGFGKLELDDGGFQRFIGDVLAWLNRSGITQANRAGRIVLSAHSGGYGGAGGVLTRGGMNSAISDVILFDSAYGYYDAFANWAREPGHHILSIFTDDTSTGNTVLMGMLQTASPNLFVWLADNMTLDRLATRAPTFILTTTVAHDDLLQKFSWYALFLQTTALGAIA
ncbi:MAG: hypothetical protein JO165_13935 [Candidatus Eremiobacteraeota bacterium]|nr:hypothetical protein [Candidatus Eremiobacteraeota bacterium]